MYVWEERERWAGHLCYDSAACRDRDARIESRESEYLALQRDFIRYHRMCCRITWFLSFFFFFYSRANIKFPLQFILAPACRSKSCLCGLLRGVVDMATALVDMSESRSFRMLGFFFMFWIIFYDTVTAEVCLYSTVNLQRLDSANWKTWTALPKPAIYYHLLSWDRSFFFWVLFLQNYLGSGPGLCLQWWHMGLSDCPLPHALDI